MKQVTREQAEDLMIDNDCNTVESMAREGDLSYLSDIFYGGFKGYSDYTNAELEAEHLEVFETEISIITDGYMCSNCGGGFNKDEMVFDENNDNDFCKDCAE